jgi:hypothetical protein
MTINAEIVSIHKRCIRSNMFYLLVCFVVLRVLLSLRTLRRTMGTHLKNTILHLEFIPVSCLYPVVLDFCHVRVVRWALWANSNTVAVAAVVLALVRF